MLQKSYFFFYLYFYWVFSKLIFLVKRKVSKSKKSILYLSAFFSDNAGYHWRVKKWAEELGIAKEFEFLGQLNNPNEFLKNLDVFWMTSREDPFPLVCIEAANNGVPILMFNKTTGTQEIINDLDYLIASDLNPKDLAHKTNELINNQELYLKTVKILKERFSMFTVDNQSKKIFEVINRIVN